MNSEERDDKEGEGNTTAARQEGRRTGISDRCDSELLKKNMARHRGTCGVEVERERDVNIAGKI